MRSILLSTPAAFFVLFLMLAHCEMSPDAPETGQIQLNVSFAKSDPKPAKIQEITQLCKVQATVQRSDGLLLHTVDLQHVVTATGINLWTGNIEIEPTDDLTVVVRAFEGDVQPCLIAVGKPAWKGQAEGVDVQLDRMTSAEISLRKCGIFKIGCPDPECCP